MPDQERCAANLIAVMCLIIRGKRSRGVLGIISGLLRFLTDCPFEGPRQPVGGVLEDLGRMLLQGGQVFKGVYFLQVAGVNQAHEQVADISPVLGFVEQRVFPMQN